MIQAFFLWFYCLSIAKALLLIIITSAVYLVLRQHFRENRFGRPGTVLLLLACLMAIAVITLTSRVSGMTPNTPELLPFHSYRTVMAGENPELLRSNFMNAVLFYPAGLLGCDLLPEGWSRKRRIFVGAGLCVLLSLGIECSQYLFSLGQAEADDVIHNGLGSLLGGAVCEILPRRRKIAL